MGSIYKLAVITKWHQTIKMKNIIKFTLLLILFSCQEIRENKIEATKHEKSENRQQKREENFDGLFKLDIKDEENFIRIVAPKNSNFTLPDSTAKTEPYKFGDFNADKKQDVLVYLGACGTGGCMYGLFLNQFENYYRLAFMDYLKNVEFKKGKNDLWTIESSEEIEPYNPSKLQITIFKFDKKKYQYIIDSTYIRSY